MSSTQHQLIEQCATRLRGIVEALDNIHDTSPQRWSTDLDDVHSSAESLLALIKDQAPPSEDQLIAAGLSYPLAKEDAVKLWYAGFRSEVVTVLEAWEAIGHDIGMNPSKGELLESLRNMAAICNAHGNDMPAQSAIDQRQVIADAITGALAFGAQASQPPAEDHWLRPFYDIGRAEGQRTQELAMLVRMLASSLKRHAPESNLVARATNYLAAKGLAGTPLRDPPAPVEQAGRDVEPAPCPFCGGEVGPTGWLRGDGTRGPECNYCGATARSMEAWQTRAALAQPEGAPVIGCLCGMPMTEGHHSPDGCCNLEEFAPQEQAEQAEAERPEVVASSAAADIVGDVCDLDPEDDGPDCVRVNVKDLLRICERHIVGVAQELGNHKARADRFLRLLHDEKKRTDKASSTSYAAGVDDAEHGKVGGKWRTRLFDEATNRANDLGYEGVLDALGDLKKTTQRLHEVAATCATAEQERDAALARVADLETELKDQRALCDVALTHSARLAKLEGQEPVALANRGLHAFWVKWTEAAAGLYGPGIKLYAHPVAQAQHSVPQAWLDVQAERRRQVTAEGWTPEHDDEHSHGQMARAAACYALAGSSAPNDGTAALLVSLAWPWDEQWWKPSTARRDMVKACALALAEIERLDRACISQSPQPGATTASS
ncbi:TPA: hypothetical protein ACQGTZ_000201 [Pseudomonas aeruginosa]